MGLSSRSLAGDCYLEQERRQERCDWHCQNHSKCVEAGHYYIEI